MSLVLTKSTRQPSKEQLLLGQQPEVVLNLTGEGVKKSFVILAEPGRLYRLVDAKTGDTARPAQVKRQGRKLVVQLEDEQNLEILDFFNEAPDSLKSEFVIQSATAETAAVMVGSDGAQASAAIAESLQLLWTPMGLASLPVNAGAIGVLSVAGALAAQTAKNDDVKGAQPATLSPTGSVVKGQFMAGPVLQGHDLLVSLYDLDGNLLGSALLDAQGRFSINIGNYMGPILAKVVDPPNSQSADFFDEGTERPKDLNAFMMAVDVVSNSNSVVTLNVNEATTAAARLAGFNAVDGSGSFDRGTAVQSIQTANAAVGQLIALNEL